MNESTISREIYYFRKESHKNFPHKPTIFELFGLQRATFLLLGAAILLVVVFFKELVVECDCGGDRGRFGSVASTRAFTMISARTSPVARHNDGFFRTFFMLGCLHQVFSQSDQQCPRDPRKRRGRGRRQRKPTSIEVRIEQRSIVESAYFMPHVNVWASYHSKSHGPPAAGAVFGKFRSLFVRSEPTISAF